MLHRRVPVLKLGSRGPGGEQKSLRLCPHAFAKRLQAPVSVAYFLGVEKSSGNAERSSLLNSRRVSASQECQQSQESGGPGRETQNCRHFWTRVGSSRLKSISSHRNRQGRGRETQNCRQLWIGIGSSCFKSSNIHGDWGFVVAKRRTTVAFGLAFGRRVSKVPTGVARGVVLSLRCMCQVSGFRFVDPIRFLMGAVP